jgi:cell wall assembly regulator SMI1
MRSNGAPLLADNLAPGAKPGPIQKLEHKLGFKVPAGLRALWLLHDGQRKALNGFIGPLQLLPIAWVLNERANTLKLVARFRGTRRGWKSAGLTPEEAESTNWLPIAARGDVSLVVHAGTGRVFAGDLTEAEDETPVHLVAPSVPQWLAAYVESVEADEFELVSGLGDYYLSPRETPA